VKKVADAAFCSSVGSYEDMFALDELRILAFKEVATTSLGQWA
jgi:hypothetical protein